jgi:hypothetical protein
MKRVPSFRPCQIAWLLLLLSGPLVYGQTGNLVPNSSFEAYTGVSNTFWVYPPREGYN